MRNFLSILLHSFWDALHQWPLPVVFLSLYVRAANWVKWFKLNHELLMSYGNSYTCCINIFFSCNNGVTSHRYYTRNKVCKVQMNSGTEMLFEFLHMLCLRSVNVDIQLMYVKGWIFRVCIFKFQGYKLVMGVGENLRFICHQNQKRSVYVSRRYDFIDRIVSYKDV